MAGAADFAAATGTGIGGGLGVWAVLKFIRWLVEFICKRQDIRSGRLDAREKSLEAKFNTRLAQVEIDCARFRMATMRLLNRMAEIMPQDPVLLEIAMILREAIPMDEIDDDLERLIRQAKRSGE